MKGVTLKPGQFRPGKTKRDHESGAWTQRMKNQVARADRDKDSGKKK